MYRPRAFWWIMGFMIGNFLIYSWFMYGQSIWRVIEEFTMFNVSYLLMIILLHSLKLLAMALMWSVHRVIYYLQISSMLAAVVGWLLVIPFVPRQFEVLLMANMVGYTLCLVVWLNPRIKRLYDIIYQKAV